MLSQLLSRVLMVFVLMQFKQNLGADTLDPLLTTSTNSLIPQPNKSLPTDVIPIRHSRSRVHRHLHALAGGGLGTTTSNNTESFVLLGKPINNAQLPFNYANDFQKASFDRTSYTLENVQLISNSTTSTLSTMSAGDSAMHKIRKLHKKQLMENMRNTVHHRSLIKAEQISESQTSDKLITSPIAEDANNLMYFSDQSYIGFINNTPNIKVEDTQKMKSKNKSITKLYLVNGTAKEEAKEMKSTQITDEDQQSISASDLNDLNESTNIVGKVKENGKENTNINIDTNLSSLEQQNETESEISFEYTSDRMAYTTMSPQTISDEGNSHVEKQLLNKEDLTLDFMWNENDTYAPNKFANTRLDEEIVAERQSQSQLQSQQQQQQQETLLAFDLPENNLKGITLVDKVDEATPTTDFTLIDNNHANGFPLDSDDNMLSVAGEDEELMESNQLLEGVIDAANEDEIYDWDEISRNNRRNLMRGRDVVTKFLQIVETQHSLGSNCEAGTSLNLGEGVVDRYAQDRFRVEAEVAVNRANMLTRIFKMTSQSVQADVNLLHASVLSMVEFDDDIFAAGNCFDWNEHPSQAGLFCPFAYRLPPPHLGAIIAKDLANEYHYLGNTSEWFFQARKNAEKVIAKNEQYAKAFHLYSNKTEERIEDDTLTVKYEDGRWSKPYYDCGGGNIWMLTYTVPFFGYENGTYHFKGTSGIDIDLRRVDIDQCPQRNTPGSTQPLNIFAGTDKCKQRTTMCQAIKGLGFRRGSYKCLCRKGYFFPDITTMARFFNGSQLEEEYEKLMLGKNSSYNIYNEYECLPCAEGCDSCEDKSPCIAALNWPMRTSILVLACTVIGLLPPAAWFTFRYQQVKVVRAASPALLRVIALGAFFIYCTNILMYPNPNLYTCTARIWLREIGFSLTYGALMLKTWRISVIFRVRSAKAVKITDAALLKRLGIICAVIGTCLLVRTLVAPPDVVVKRTADDLKAFLCKTDWWDYTFTSMEVSFLAWGVRLCIMVRKAPSEFNESRFISMAIYNEFLLTCFLNVSMFFLQSPANPDLLYIIFFCHTQLTVTLLLCLIFGSKVYIVLRSGKTHQDSAGMVKATTTKFNFRPQVRTFANTNALTTSSMSGTGAGGITTSETKLSDQEALDEIRQLSVRLQRIQEMAPPKGVAVMTISSLLDGLRTPGSVMLVTAAANSAVTQITNGERIVAAQQPLPLLADMQNYQKTRSNNTLTAIVSSPTATTTPLATAKEIVQKCSKALNTDLSTILGNNEPTPAGYVICSRCLTFSKDNLFQMATCQELGSPQTEGSISFSKLKLDCMCSQSEDLNIYQSRNRLSEEDTTDVSRTPSRRKQMRSAATNTPPLPLSIRCKDCHKLSSSCSLQGTSSLNAHQTCDNCKKRLRCSTFSGNNNSNTKTKRKKTQKRLTGSGVLINKRARASIDDDNEGSTTMHSTSDIAFCAPSASFSTSKSDLSESSSSSSSISLSSSECTVTRGLTKERFTKSEILLNANSANKLPHPCVPQSSNSATAAVAAIEDVVVGSTSTTTSTVTSNKPSREELPSDPESNKTNGQQTGAVTQAKRPDKLMLDLNDRSKYTKEVSV